MSDQDVIREALTLSSLQRPRKLRIEEGLAALDALVARYEVAEQALREIADERLASGDHMLRSIARAALDAQPADQRSRREA